VLPEQIARLQQRLRGIPDAERARAGEAWDHLARGLVRLQAAGVRIGIGTDGGGQQGDQFVGWTMHAEMENLVTAGLTLTAATRTSAEVLGLRDLGTLAPGRSADFVVLDANPLDDITNTRTIDAVYLRGRKLDRARLARGFRGQS
jgi:imidazolonepropionase-like amidohydrolase